MFRLSFMIEEQFGDNFKSVFDIRKACKNEQIKETLKYFNKEIERFLKDNDN